MSEPVHTPQYRLLPPSVLTRIGIDMTLADDDEAITRVGIHEEAESLGAFQESTLILSLAIIRSAHDHIPCLLLLRGGDDGSITHDVDLKTVLVSQLARRLNELLDLHLGVPVDGAGCGWVQRCPGCHWSRMMLFVSDIGSLMGWMGIWTEGDKCQKGEAMIGH